MKEGLSEKFIIKKNDPRFCISLKGHEIPSIGGMPLSMNPLVWLDSSVASSKEYSSGDILSKWKDLSGNNYHFNEVYTSQPTSQGADPVYTDFSAIGKIDTGLTSNYAFSSFTSLHVFQLTDAEVSIDSIFSGLRPSKAGSNKYYNVIGNNQDNSISFQAGDGTDFEVYKGYVGDRLNRKIIVINRLNYEDGLYKSRQIIHKKGDFSFSYAASAYKHKTFGWMVGGVKYQPPRGSVHYDHMVFDRILLDIEVDALVNYLKQKRGII